MNQVGQSKRGSFFFQEGERIISSMQLTIDALFEANKQLKIRLEDLEAKQRSGQ